MVRSFRVAMRRMGEMFLFGMLGLLLIVVISIVHQYYRTHIDPLRNWFYPVHLHVPNHCAGSDPKVTYDRQIFKSFDNSFHSQFVSVKVSNDLGFPICAYQSQVFKYYPKSELRANPRLSEFMGRSCVLLSGKYRAEVTWTPKRPGYLDETVSLVSNIFEVYPRTAEVCEDHHE